MWSSRGVGAAALAAALGACAPPEPAGLLLVSLDTTRRDHVSAYGYALDTTPTLRRLAAEGARVELAYAPTATTAPSHATLFTALYPISHRVLRNGVPLAAHHRTLAEALAQRGYQTAAVVSSFVLDAKFGLARGFESWDDELRPEEGKPTAVPRFEGHPLAGAFDRRADHTTRRAILWLTGARDPERPFFLFVHYFDPHAPYAPPDEMAARFAPPEAESTGLERTIARYDAEVAFADRELGVLLEALDGLGLGARTLVAVTADHGEGLYDHGHMEHGVQIYEEAVRVPLLFRWPGRIPAGRVLAGPVELVDLAPTLLALLGVPFDAEPFAGRSLARALTDGAPLDPDRPVYLYRRPYAGGERFGALEPRGEQLGIRAGPWKYIEGELEGRRELFDLSRDPGETRNLVDEEPERAAALAARLRAWRSAHAAADPAALPTPSPEDRARLRALGYGD